MNQRQYVDPSNYLDHMELLATFTTEVDRSKVKLEEMIGQGKNYSFKVINRCRFVLKPGFLYS